MGGGHSLGRVTVTKLGPTSKRGMSQGSRSRVEAMDWRFMNSTESRYSARIHDWAEASC